MKIFADTNILIDLVCHRQDFFREAQILFMLAEEKKLEIAISTLSYINTYYVGVRNKYDYVEIRDVLSQIKMFTEMVSLTKRALSNALKLKVKDMEDAVQYYSAKSCGAEVIVTRNKKDFAFSEIKVLTPTEFLEEYKAEFIGFTSFISRDFLGRITGM